MTCKKLLSYFFIGDEMKRLSERLNNIEKKIPKTVPVIFVREYEEVNKELSLVKVVGIKKPYQVVCTKEKEIENIIQELEYIYGEVISFDERGMLEDD